MPSRLEWGFDKSPGESCACRLRLVRRKSKTEILICVVPYSIKQSLLSEQNSMHPEYQGLCIYSKLMF
jgi:hypothetical protein